MSEIEKSSEVAALTVQLLSAYLSNNTVPSEGLADLIRSTRTALTEEAAADPVQPESETYTPAVSVRKSLASQDHIISLIDGKPYKVLKRHLSTHGLTPDSYRERYGLPASYPMVAPSFAAHRRAIAERIGLGNRKGGKAAPSPAKAASADAPVNDATAPAVSEAPAATPAAKRSARPAGAAKTAAPKAKPAPTPALENDTASAPAPATRKPRGKLGLFGKGAAAASTPAPATTPVTDEAPAAAAAKPARAKRMARTPTAETGEAPARKPSK